MRKIVITALSFALLITPLSVSAHSGRTDSSGGHNCSSKSKSKGLCSGYHYHNSGGSNSSSVDSTYDIDKILEEMRAEREAEERRIQEELNRIEEQRRAQEEARYLEEKLKQEEVLRLQELKRQEERRKLQEEQNHLKAQKSGIKVKLNSKEVSFDQSPVIVNGRTLVPLRSIFENLGAELNWDGSTQTITAKKGSNTIILIVGNHTAYLNGKAIIIDSNPIIIAGRTMVPARFISESLGAQVNWDNLTQTVSIDVVEEKTPAIVTEVVDGDTIKVNLNGKEETIRLLLVDTPETKDPNEPVQPFGPEASAFAKEKLEGKTVQLEFDGPERDKYDRLLAYVWIDDKSFNQMLLEEGLARVAYVYDPPYTHYDEYIEAEKIAKDSKKVIWSIENYVQEDGFHEEVAN